MEKEKARFIYLAKVAGPEGLEIAKRLSKNGLTDQQIAEETGRDLNLVRRTLYTLYEHHLVSYDLERDKETGWMLYRWHLDFADVDRRLADDARKLIFALEKWLDEEQNTVYYTCDNHCGRYTFAMASGEVCGYEFVCPTCKHSLYYDDTSTLTDAMQEKLDEFKTDVTAIFYPENASIFELALAGEE